MVRLIIIAFFLLTLCSCSEKEKKTDHLIININPDKAEELNLNNWFKKIEIIPLETTKESLLTGCWKIIEYENRYYIQDQRQNSLFVFNNTGKFLFSTKNLKGKGPNEYLSCTDFVINQFTNNIELLDPVALKIRVLDTNGNFLNDIALIRELLPLSSFIPITNDIYLFYAKSSRRNNSLVFYSKSRKRILSENEYLPINACNLTSTINSPFYFLNQRIYFSHIFPSNTLFYINTEQLQVEKLIEFNFGKYNFTLDLLPDEEEKEYYRSYMRKNNDKYAFVINKKETTNYILVFYLFKEKLHIAKYNKNSKQLQVCFKEYNTLGQLLPPVLAEENILYSVTEPGHIKYIISDQLLDENSRNILLKIKENDNPVIMKYTLL